MDRLHLVKLNVHKADRQAGGSKDAAGGGGEACVVGRWESQWQDIFGVSADCGAGAEGTEIAPCDIAVQVQACEGIGGDGYAAECV